MERLGSLGLATVLVVTLAVCSSSSNSPPVSAPSAQALCYSALHYWSDLPHVADVVNLALRIEPPSTPETYTASGSYLIGALWGAKVNLAADTGDVTGADYQALDVGAAEYCASPENQEIVTSINDELEGSSSYFDGSPIVAPPIYE